MMRIGYRSYSGAWGLMNMYKMGHLFVQDDY